MDATNDVPDGSNLERLAEMGFDFDDACRALASCKNDINAAVSILLKERMHNELVMEQLAAGYGDRAPASGKVAGLAEPSASPCTSPAPQWAVGTQVLAKYKETSRTYKPATVVGNEGACVVVRFDGYGDEHSIPSERVKDDAPAVRRQISEGNEHVLDLDEQRFLDEEIAKVEMRAEDEEKEVRTCRRTQAMPMPAACPPPPLLPSRRSVRAAWLETRHSLPCPVPLSAGPPGRVDRLDGDRRRIPPGGFA
jgi:hypothetical protein